MTRTEPVFNSVPVLLAAATAAPPAIAPPPRIIAPWRPELELLLLLFLPGGGRGGLLRNGFPGGVWRWFGSELLLMSTPGGGRWFGRELLLGGVKLFGADMIGSDSVWRMRKKIIEIWEIMIVLNFVIDQSTMNRYRCRIWHVCLLVVY